MVKLRSKLSISMINLKSNKCIEFLALTVSKNGRSYWLDSWNKEPKEHFGGLQKSDQATTAPLSLRLEGALLVKANFLGGALPFCRLPNAFFFSSVCQSWLFTNRPFVKISSKGPKRFAKNVLYQRHFFLSFYSFEYQLSSLSLII